MIRLVPALLLLLATTAGAAPSNAPGPPGSQPEYLAYQPPQSGGESAGWIAARLFSSLLLVGGLLAGGLFVYRRWMGRGALGQRSDLIRVVSRSYIGPKESLCLVRVGKEHLLVGVTGSQISFLHRWEGAVPIEPSVQEGWGGGGRGGDGGGFSRQFEASASRLRLTGLESSIRSHIMSLKGHLASLGRPSKETRDA